MLNIERPDVIKYVKEHGFNLLAVDYYDNLQNCIEFECEKCIFSEPELDCTSNGILIWLESETKIKEN